MTADEVVRDDEVAAGGAGCAVAACVRELTVMRATGMIATSAMRVRMAPPFVGRECALLCSVLAGSGHCIHSPDGERKGIDRPGCMPQGVRPVWLRPGLRRGNTTRFVVDRDHGSVCRWPIATMARRGRGSTRFMPSSCRESVDSDWQQAPRSIPKQCPAWMRS